jgi:hypothetical protein
VLAQILDHPTGKKLHMKKPIAIAALLFFAFSAKSQNPKIFGQIGAGYYNGSGIQGNSLSEGGRSGGFGIEGTLNALSGNVVGLGLGIDLIKFNNTDGPFLPIFADFKFIAPGKARFYILIDPGYCIYHYSSQGTTQTGGLYIAGGMGVWLPSKTQQKLFVQVKYNFITINSTVVGFPDTSSGSMGVFSFLIGVKL